MLGYIFLMATLAATSLGQSTTVQSCSNNAPLPLNVHIEGCTEPPCGLPQLQEAVIRITFKSPRLLKSMRTRAVAYMGFLPIPYPLGAQENSCRGLTNSRCPVLAGEVLQYKLEMFIENFMPVGTSVNLEFSLIDDQLNNNILCIRIPIRVDPPLLQ